MSLTKEYLAVMQAYEDGKTIQIQDRVKKNEWKDYKGGEPIWNWVDFDYRVKPPEPKLRPYKDAEELMQAQREHGLYIEIDKGHYVLPTNILGTEIQIHCSKQIWSFNELVDKKWADGTPCGVMEG